MDLHQQSRKLYEEIDDKAGIANALNRIGNIYEARGEMDAAVKGFNPLAEGGDLAAKWLMTQALHCCTHGVPADWNGVEVMESK